MNQYRVQRLKELVSYERVTAPFPGIITQRNIDLGSLVSAGSSASVPVLYHLAKIDRLRIYVDVPRSDSESFTSARIARFMCGNWASEVFRVQ